jgi:hypothetical protein
MNEADRRKLYQDYIRLVAGTVFAYPEWKRTLRDLPFGRRFAIDVAGSKPVTDVIREFEACQSRGLQLPPGAEWLDEARRQGVRVEDLRVVVFRGSDPEPASESGSRLRFWFKFESPLPKPESETSACWYTLESVEFPDIRMEFGFSA